MNMTIAKITAVVMVLVSVLCACAPVNVEAASTYALKNLTATQYDGSVCTVQYYAPLDYPNVLVVKKNSSTCYIIYYNQETTVKGASTGSSDKYTFTGGTALYATTTSLGNAKTVLFEGGTPDFTEATEIIGLSTLYIYSEDAKPGNTSRMGDAESLESVYYNYYYEKNGEYPTFIGQEGENGDVSDKEEEESGGTITGGTIWDTIKGFWSGGNTFILDLAGEKINEKLAENKAFNSIISIRNTLKDLFNADYSDPNGFYELGLTNLTLGKVRQPIYINHGTVAGEPWEQQVGELVGTGIDYGLENQKVLNLDWYFGKVVAKHDFGNYYTKGMKPYIDGIISAFLWVMFAWALYKNMPNWISGELTQISNLASTPFKNNDYNDTYEAYKERMDRNAEYKQRYNDEKKGK